jgi:hypothetical protein
LGIENMARRSATARRAVVDDCTPATLDAPPDRLAALETAIAAIQQTLDVQFARMAQMQAQIDRLIAKHDHNIGSGT